MRCKCVKTPYPLKNALYLGLGLDLSIYHLSILYPIYVPLVFYLRIAGFIFIVLHLPHPYSLTLHTQHLLHKTI